MGPLDAKEPKYGVEITDSPYVVLSMRVMARIGTDVLNKIAETEAFFVPALHSVGAPLEDGQEDVPGPSIDTKWIVTSPEDRSVLSYDSDNAAKPLLAKQPNHIPTASA